MNHAHAFTAAAIAATSFLPVGSASAQAGWAAGTAFDSFVGGTEGNSIELRICRSTDAAYPGIHPGKSRDAWNACSIGFGNEEKYARSYETLRPVWASVSAGSFWTFGNENGKALALCRANLGGGIHVGKKLPGDDACYIGFDGKEQRVTPYEVLSTSGGFGYRTYRPTRFEPTALIAGRESNGTPLYACVGSWQGGWHPGKLRRDFKGCHIGYGGREEEAKDYAVVVLSLVSPELEGFEGRPMYVAGRDVNGEALGLCTAWFENSTHVGKYRAAGNTCNIGWGGKEYPLPVGFSVLRTN